MIEENFMIDIETMGTGEAPVIVSIGAVKFNIETGEILDTFYRNVSIQSCLDIGLMIDASTLEWWIKQSDEARNAMFENPVAITLALTDLRSFMNNPVVHNEEETTPVVWGRGPSFDCSHLKSAYLRCHLNIPWHFRNERCVRTIMDIKDKLMPDFEVSYPDGLVAHNALDDCIKQACDVSAVIHELGLWSNEILE